MGSSEVVARIREVWREEGILIMNDFEERSKIAEPILTRDEAFNAVLHYSSEKKLLPEWILERLKSNTSFREEVMYSAFPARFYGK